MCIETEPRTLTTSFNSDDIYALVTPGWNQTVLHGDFGDPTKRDPEFKILTTLETIDAQPDHARPLSLGVLNNQRLHLIVHGWNAVRFMTDVVTEFIDVDVIAGDHTQKVRSLGIANLRVHNLDWLIDWIGLRQQYSTIHEISESVMRSKRSLIG